MFDIPLHKLVIHFPIALTLIALVYDGWASFYKRPELHDLGYGLSLWASVFAIIAVLTGFQIASLGQIGKGAVTGHVLFGVSATIVLVAFGLGRYAIRARQAGPDEHYSKLWLILQALAALLVGATAITGHRLFLSGGL